MIVFPNAKINIGLQVLKKRVDHYHELETVFYPIKLYDVLEVIQAKEMAFYPTGISVEGDGKDNICVKAYHLLAKDYDIPAVEIHLHKNIPIGAGLGGGSSDAAFMIKLLNEKFSLGISSEKMEGYAKQLGADCAFFIRNTPVFATGIGTDFTPLDLDLSSYHFCVVKPPIHISTAEAYQSVVPDKHGKDLKTNMNRPITEWNNTVINDFEAGIFNKYPEIERLKKELYQAGAIYASMSGSGSSVFGIFKDQPTFLENKENYRIFYC
ncbi:MAG TPA: 4-(cytidine 5'-diphospho)-2-C-methyl-D-erythritol kinase [Dysgonamonadaceae bacterium]|nr:4-(cytidine 5'-diphospho)-2-C-methyl-D-erythritol kinase [Dysgonamonadaceae bacterium]